MLTIKQLQAFYWVSRLGTLSKAAAKLHITQSAATKRLQEVEALARFDLFENEGRKDRLTPKGKELVKECESLFTLLDQLEMLKGTSNLPARTLHVGLTELTALTWFPDFIKLMKKTYPSITIQPEIDLSTLLYMKVKEGGLDFAFLPDLSPDEGLAKIAIGNIAFGWFAAPGTFAPECSHDLKSLAEMTVIEQSANSIITELCAQLWENAGVQPMRVYGGNNVNALAGLISAGIGISCLPVAMFEHEINRGTLHLVTTTPEAPSVTYNCYFLKHLHSALGYTISEIAKQAYQLSAVY